jgi:hypothetical protein
VKKVLSNTIYYAKIFGQSSQSLKQRLGVIQPANEKNRKAYFDEH